MHQARPAGGEWGIVRTGKPGRVRRAPALVPTSRYQKYVPATTTTHVDKHQWGGLVLNVFRFPDVNEGVTAPGIDDFGIACPVSGVSKGYFNFDRSKWGKGALRKETTVPVNRRAPMARQWKPARANEAIPLCVNLIVDAGLLNKVALEALDCRIEIELQNRVDVRGGLIGELANALRAEAENNTPLGKLYGETAAQLLAVHILRKHCTVRHKVPDHRSGLSRRQLNKVREYVEAYLDRDISLQTLARLCGLSAYHFARMFKASTGLPPHRYLMERRIEKAKRLLTRTDLPILHIALQAGYKNQNHFTCAFKRITGFTPGQYRKKS